MNHLGVWSASALSVVGLTYLAVLAVGFASAGLAKPFVNPVLALCRRSRDMLGRQ